MNQIDDLTEAFQNVNKFENYRFLKSWGIMIIVFGISGFISSTRYFLHYIINEVFQVELFQASLFTRFFLSILDFVTLLVLLVILIYTFISVKKTSIVNNNVITLKNFRFGLALLVLYLISSRLTIFFPIPFSIHIPEVIGACLAFLIMRDSLKSHHFKELFYLTLMFTFLTLIDILGLMGLIFFFFYSEYFGVLFFTHSLVINIYFMTCYIIIGRYSLKKASTILRSTKIPD